MFTRRSLAAISLFAAMAAGSGALACRAAPECDDELRPDAAGCPPPDAAGDARAIALEAAIARQAESGADAGAWHVEAATALPRP